MAVVNKAKGDFVPKDDISMEERNDEWGKGCVKDGKRCFDCGDCVDDDECECCAPVLRVQSPHKVIFLQYDPEACDEITWCQDQIDQKDTVYHRDDVVRLLATAVIDAHAPKCVYPGGEITCLCDEGEVCSIHMSGKAGCKWWTVCDCEACKSARAILELKPESC